MNKNAFDFIRNSLNRIADGIASSDGRYPVWDYKSLLELINTLEEEYKKNDGASARSSLQQTCNNLATDTISRASAITEITEYGSGRTVYMSVGELKRRIEQLPSAQPERDIPKKPNETTDRTWGIPHRQAVCPNCDRYIGTMYFLGEGKRKISYCDSCGQAIDWSDWRYEDE